MAIIPELWPLSARFSLICPILPYSYHCVRVCVCVRFARKGNPQWPTSCFYPLRTSVLALDVCSRDDDDRREWDQVCPMETGRRNAAAECDGWRWTPGKDQVIDALRSSSILRSSLTLQMIQKQEEEIIRANKGFWLKSLQTLYFFISYLERLENKVF